MPNRDGTGRNGNGKYCDKNATKDRTGRNKPIKTKEEKDESAND